MKKCDDCKYTTCHALHGSHSAQCLRSGSHLCDACTKIIELESRMIQLHLELVELARQKLDLQSIANQNHDLFGIHRVPPEIVSRIFLLYAESARLNSKPYDEKNWALSILIASICKAWRNVALSTPELWSSPNLLLTSTGLKSLTELAKLCLRRSKALPLKINIFDCEDEDDGEDDYWEGQRMGDFDRLLKALGEHVNRLHTLNLTGVAQILVRRLFLKFKCMPFLHALGITIYYGDRQTFSLQDAPLLQELHIERVPVKQLDMRWSNLTSFSGYNIPTIDCLDILWHCKNLLKCEFIITETQTQHRDFLLPGLRITHPTLRCLKIGPMHETATILFLNSLDIPNLTQLVYNSNDVDFPMPIDAFLSLFAHSHCQLTKLTIVDKNKASHQISDIQLIPFLAELPSLKFLKLCGGKKWSRILTDELLQRLAVTEALEGDASKPILPNLEMIVYWGPRSFTWANVVELFPHLPYKSSFKSGSDSESAFDEPYRYQLKHIDIKFLKSKHTPDIDRAVIPRLLLIQEGGVTWNISSHDGKDLLQASLKRFGEV